jgi:hypothetical protein
LPVVGESESSVECNVACADEKSGGRAEDKSNGRDGSVVKDLVSNDSVHKQNPEGGYDRGNVDCGECYPYGATEREPANGEDLADGDDDVSYEEKLHFSVGFVSVRITLVIVQCLGVSHLRPTAARFMFERIIRNTATKTARPAHSIEPSDCQRYALPDSQQVCDVPKFARLRPPLKGIPSKSQPPKPVPSLEGEPANRLHTGNVACMLPVSRQKL